MESTPSRISVRPEKCMLAWLNACQHISFRNKIRNSISGLTAHFQQASGQIGCTICLIEYFNPAAMHTIIILKVGLIVHQHLIDDQLTVRFLFCTRSKTDQQQQGKKYSYSVFSHRFLKLKVNNQNNPRITMEYFRVS